ncbi:MAG: hypothetical protein ILP10_08155 [Lachnospiraceae bacterium]|nr:hypothetical protein [Lachnospiraceae bacterium]
MLIISIRLAKLAAKPMEDAIEQERRFVANISHDLKTPITVILANNSILRSNRGLSDDEREQWFESTDTAAKNMMSLIGEMLTLSSLENAGKKLVMSSVNLSEAAQKASLQLESLAFERSVTMDCDIEENVNIPGTREYVERICGSLFENALKYEPDGGRVRFTLKKERKRAVLTAANYGSVIAPEDMDHIFERFYRGDKARDVKTGHGLGLPILKELIQTLGGEIEVTSSREEGTVFTLRFEAVS